ncbi:hypothetical protein C8J56DRAFT_930836 [Mycena floridula]|nr:hypothetical protein C8J56DRAFT_930836 [Mycena floridula]
MSDAVSKLDTARAKKDEGDAAFKAGKAQEALMAYHQALMYLHGLDKSALTSLGMTSTPKPSADGGAAKEKTEIDDIIEKVYANMAACHIKNGNWKRAVETANKALAKNENNYKAMFRKGKALGEEGYFEKAVKVFEDLKTKNPSDAAMADAEIARLKVIDDGRSKAASQKLKGFLNKSQKKGESLSETPVASSSSSPSA